MPLARIDLATGKSADYRKTIGEVVYQAMVETLKAPKDDRFQIITEHPGDDFVVDPNYLGIQRSKDCVIIQLTLNEGRTVDQNAPSTRPWQWDCINIWISGRRTCSSVLSR